MFQVWIASRDGFDQDEMNDAANIGFDDANNSIEVSEIDALCERLNTDEDGGQYAGSIHEGDSEREKRADE